MKFKVKALRAGFRVFFGGHPGEPGLEQPTLLRR